MKSRYLFALVAFTALLTFFVVGSITARIRAAQISSQQIGPVPPDWRPNGMPECTTERHGMIWFSRTRKTRWVCTGATDEVPKGWEILPAEVEER
jgi:hypothetical protein